ncbi:MAG: hypothetical protein COV96_00330 [Candidatus Zambryskibacteria bacterium CG11_big_fil_rev_8_21_14_0_20_42_18]|uniref:ATP-grasp domain-containing protein n=1 Tax=Candidatus Zambryskibacteria bacterium CG_4_9_14_3_um_filter_42_15 TaxID=1975112 RepID=A0A2M7WRS3_9BACT|nr:MAG: hypothetical protein COV96_00330 [Candidatus Zambryskibacteria bacterium CG11_big_fil_rev_8_21_14_0_20_42_18]PJA32566.1 MAG: hypothetical protein CO185_02495 [Candidatus Zambryskibacteria bacterium CG_4_9_14_3_um_filter_42_15]
MEKIFLFTDYRGQFYSSTKYRGAAVDLERLKNYFTKHNFELTVLPFSKIDFRTQNYKNIWVLYQSSEDPGLFYRSYVDDIVLGLYIQGAKLIPNFPQFKAHHNKHFLEILRDLHDLPDIKNIEAKRYGTYEDYLKDINNFKENILVLKSSNSSKSRGVFLLDNYIKKIKLPKIVSLTSSLQNLRYLAEQLKTGNKPLWISSHRNKFVLQHYVDGLQGDYRIVVYGEKFYVLYRGNRTDDFRASGSMKFNYNVELPEGLLDYAKKVFWSFNVPYIALDIGIKENEFFLFEFQFLSFGQYTLEKSSFYYCLRDGKWQKEYEKPDLEREIAESVSQFIESHH